ncbi:MAG TPA: hypothetical protein VK709_12715 [Candidatus Saccharimonadales bacterium]|jgi:hypothetical protein|nr:hypothetical protein [Candidatus Saccharimonadales bacterium]
MDETARKEALSFFISQEFVEYKPSEWERQLREEEQMRQDKSACFAALLTEESDHEALALELYDMIRVVYTFGHGGGMLRGYKFAKAFAKLEKGKLGKTANAMIARVLMRNPNATNKEICLALDEAEIRLHKSKSAPKNASRWSEVVKVQYYKNLISRVRKRVEKDTNLREWKEVVTMIDEFEGNLKGVKRTNIDDHI